MKLICHNPDRHPNFQQTTKVYEWWCHSYYPSAFGQHWFLPLAGWETKKHLIRWWSIFDKLMHLFEILINLLFVTVLYPEQQVRDSGQEWARLNTSSRTRLRVGAICVNWLWVERTGQWHVRRRSCAGVVSMRRKTENCRLKAKVTIGPCCSGIWILNDYFVNKGS